MSACFQTQTVRVQPAQGDCFVADAYVSAGPTKLTEKPYNMQEGRFRLFTDRMDVQPGDRIDTFWRVTEVDNRWVGRAFCNVQRVMLRNACEAELIELTKQEGVDAKTTPVVRYRLTVGMQDVKESAFELDERKVPLGSRMFVLCDHAEQVVPERWMVRVDDGDWIVTEMVDVGRADRPAILITRKR